MSTITPQSKTHLSGDTLRQQLHLYTLAAGAAGVSMLAVTQPAEAEIVYTPTDISISGNITIPLDINNDGTPDFSFKGLSDTTSNRFSDIIFAQAASGHSANGFAGGGTPLRAGVRIGSAYKFSSFATMAQGRFNSPRSWFCSGQWANVHGRYLGLKFMINGEVHYGWARLIETCRKGANTAIVTGYAYETIPNRGLKAGHKKGKLADQSLNESGEPAPATGGVPTPATLGMLAQGAPALSIWRRE